MKDFTPNILETKTKPKDYTLVRKRYLVDQIRALEKQRTNIQIDELFAPILGDALFDHVSAVNFKVTLTMLIQDYRSELHDLIDRWEEINS